MCKMWNSIHYFSVGLAIKEAINPNTIAAAIPPAVAVIPPVNIPINPFSSIAFTVPLKREYPKQKLEQ